MIKRMVIMLLLTGLFFGAVFGFKAFVNQQIADYFANIPEEVVTINASEVQKLSWVEQLLAIGTLTPVNGADIASEVAGVVKSIHFDNGSRVRKGQTLIQLDTETDEADLQRLKAVARLAELELQRARRLFEQKTISEAEWQRRQSEAEQAKAAVGAQQARIAQKTIKAPFDGIAGIRRVNLGQFISAGDPLVALESLNPLFVQFTLPERRLQDVQVGQTIQIDVDAIAQAFSGRITAIEPRISPATRTFEVQATLANPDEILRAGLFARVTLATGEPQPALVIPQSAVRYSPYGNSVFVIHEDDSGQLRVMQRFVQTGERRGDMIRVTRGLEAGERIAASGLLKLQNNTPVTLSDKARPSEDLNPQPRNP